jgi:hypothetical protein
MRGKGNILIANGKTIKIRTAAGTAKRSLAETDGWSVGVIVRQNR